jgi:hypothetical protein
MTELTLGGWIFMIASIAGVLALLAFCYRRTLSAHRPIKPPPDSLGG